MQTLWRENPCLSMSNVVNQVEVPFSWERSVQHWRKAQSCPCRSLASPLFLACLLEWVLALMACWTSWHPISWWFCWRTRSTSEALMSFDVACCSAKTATGLIKPSPQSRAGSARRSRTRSPWGSWPVRAGTNCDWIADSSGWRSSEVNCSSLSVTWKDTSTMRKGHALTLHKLHEAVLWQIHWVSWSLSPTSGSSSW